MGRHKHENKNKKKQEGGNQEHEKQDDDEEEEYSVQSVLEDPTASNVKYGDKDAMLDIHASEDRTQWIFCGFTGHKLLHPFALYSFVATLCAAVCFQGALINPEWTIIYPPRSPMEDCMGALDDTSWVEGDWHRRCYAGVEFGPSYSTYAEINDITVAHTAMTLKELGATGGVLPNSKGMCAEFELYPQCPHMREDFGLVSFLGYKCKAIEAVCTSRFVTACNVLLQIGVFCSSYAAFTSLILAFEICHMPSNFRRGPKTAENMRRWNDMRGNILDTVLMTLRGE
jgi:hypothetical protein